MNESDNGGITRREVLKTLGAAAVVSAAGGKAIAAQPGRGRQATEFLIRGGHVISMDSAIGELRTGNVHIRDGVIVAVGPTVNAPGATVVDATNAIVMPGFVETHWHMWNSIWRGMAHDATDYFRLQSLRNTYSVGDHYVAVKYAALEAINAGITTCHNWAHGVRDYADLEAEMRALADSGIRARMGHTGVLVSGPTTPGDLQRALDWIAKNGQGRMSLGMLLDGAGESFPRQVQAARRLGLKTITDHGGFLAFPDLLGPEFLMTHGTSLTPAQMELIARRDVKVGLCPTSDPMIGAGLPPIYPLLMAGVPLRNISFTLDVTAQAPADPFGSLRTLVNAGRIQQSGSNDLSAIAQAHPTWKFTYRDAIELGTLSGANVLGIADQTGSLTPGKRADVIVVRMDEINMLPVAESDVTMQLVQHAQPANVDTVFIDGQLRKQAGKLVGVDVRKIVAEAAAAQVALRERAKAR
ncbi:MAG: amidohydrolase family protein [Steroidobacteraceae bacterium]